MAKSSTGETWAPVPPPPPPPGPPPPRKRTTPRSSPHPPLPAMLKTPTSIVLNAPPPPPPPPPPGPAPSSRTKSKNETGIGQVVVLDPRSRTKRPKGTSIMEERRRAAMAIYESPQIVLRSSGRSEAGTSVSSASSPLMMDKIDFSNTDGISPTSSEARTEVRSNHQSTSETSTSTTRKKKLKVETRELELTVDAPLSAPTPSSSTTLVSIVPKLPSSARNAKQQQPGKRRFFKNLLGRNRSKTPTANNINNNNNNNNSGKHHPSRKSPARSNGGGGGTPRSSNSPRTTRRRDSSPKLGRPIDAKPGDSYMSTPHSAEIVVRPPVKPILPNVTMAAAAAAAGIPTSLASELRATQSEDMQQTSRALELYKRRDMIPASNTFPALDSNHKDSDDDKENDDQNQDDNTSNNASSFGLVLHYDDVSMLTDPTFGTASPLNHREPISPPAAMPALEEEADGGGGGGNRDPFSSFWDDREALVGEDPSGFSAGRVDPFQEPFFKIPLDNIRGYEPTSFEPKLQPEETHDEAPDTYNPGRDPEEEHETYPSIDDENGSDSIRYTRENLREFAMGSGMESDVEPQLGIHVAESMDVSVFTTGSKSEIASDELGPDPPRDGFEDPAPDPPLNMIDDEDDNEDEEEDDGSKKDPVEEEIDTYKEQAEEEELVDERREQEEDPPSKEPEKQDPSTANDDPPDLGLSMEEELMSQFFRKKRVDADVSGSSGNRSSSMDNFLKRRMHRKTHKEQKDPQQAKPEPPVHPEDDSTSAPSVDSSSGLTSTRSGSSAMWLRARKSRPRQDKSSVTSSISASESTSVRSPEESIETSSTATATARALAFMRGREARKVGSRSSARIETSVKKPEAPQQQLSKMRPAQDPEPQAKTKPRIYVNTSFASEGSKFFFASPVVSPRARFAKHGRKPATGSPSPSLLSTKHIEDLVLPCPSPSSSPRKKNRGNRTSVDPDAKSTFSSDSSTVSPTKIENWVIGKGVEARYQKRQDLIDNGVIQPPAPKPKSPKQSESPEPEQTSVALDQIQMDPIKRAGARLLSKAAIPIQSAVRRYLAERIAVDRMWALIEIQSYFRRWQAEIFLQISVLAAIKIQTAFRGWHIRDSLDEAHFCATEIQRIVRGYMAAIRVYEDFYHVMVLQSAVRGMLARHIARDRLQKVVMLQAVSRGFLARFHVDFRHGAATAIQARFRAYVAQLHFQFDIVDIIIVQSVARLWQVRRRVKEIRWKTKEIESVILLQSVVRGWRVRYACKVLVCIIRAQSVVRRWIALRQFRSELVLLRNKSAITIQKVWRSFFAQTEYIYTVCDVLLVQCAARRWIARCELNRRARARYQLLENQRRQSSAAIIQRNWRRYCAQMLVLYKLVNIIIAQSIVRRYLAVCELRRMQYKNEAAKSIQAWWRIRMWIKEQNCHYAASKIQSAWRRFWQYSHYIIVLYELVKIQATVRGFLARNDSRLMIGCVIILQSHCRRFLAFKYTEEMKLSRVLVNGVARSLRETVSAKRVQAAWKQYTVKKNEKRSALVIERFFIMVKVEVDREIRRHEEKKKMQSKREKRRRQKKEADEKLLERIWLNTLKKEVSTTPPPEEKKMRSKSAPKSRQQRLQQRHFGHKAARDGNSQESPPSKETSPKETKERGVSTKETKEREAVREGRHVPKFHSIRPPPTDAVNFRFSDDVSEVTSPSIFHRGAGGWPRHAQQTGQDMEENLSLEEAWIDTTLRQAKEKKILDDQYVRRHGLQNHGLYDKSGDNGGKGDNGPGNSLRVTDGHRYTPPPKQSGMSSDDRKATPTTDRLHQSHPRDDQQRGPVNEHKLQQGAGDKYQRGSSRTYHDQRGSPNLKPQRANKDVTPRSGRSSTRLGHDSQSLRMSNPFKDPSAITPNNAAKSSQPTRAHLPVKEEPQHGQDWQLQAGSSLQSSSANGRDKYEAAEDHSSPGDERNPPSKSLQSDPIIIGRQKLRLGESLVRFQTQGDEGAMRVEPLGVSPRKLRDEHVPSLIDKTLSPTSLDKAQSSRSESSHHTTTNQSPKLSRMLQSYYRADTVQPQKQRDPSPRGAMSGFNREESSPRQDGWMPKTSSILQNSSTPDKFQTDPHSNDFQADNGARYMHDHQQQQLGLRALSPQGATQRLTTDERLQGRNTPKMDASPQAISLHDPSFAEEEIFRTQAKNLRDAAAPSTLQSRSIEERFHIQNNPGYMVSSPQQDRYPGTQQPTFPHSDLFQVQSLSTRDPSSAAGQSFTDELNAARFMRAVASSSQGKLLYQTTQDQMLDQAFPRDEVLLDASPRMMSPTGQEPSFGLMVSPAQEDRFHYMNPRMAQTFPRDEDNFESPRVGTPRFATLSHDERGMEPPPAQQERFQTSPRLMDSTFHDNHHSGTSRGFMDVSPTARYGSSLLDVSPSPTTRQQDDNRFEGGAARRRDAGAPRKIRAQKIRERIRKASSQSINREPVVVRRQIEPMNHLFDNGGEAALYDQPDAPGQIYTRFERTSGNTFQQHGQDRTGYNRT